MNLSSETQDSLHPTKIKGSETYWIPLERKSYPPYILEKIQIINQLYNLDFSAIKNLDLSDSSCQYVAFYIGHRLQALKPEAIPEAKKTDAVNVLSWLATNSHGDTTISAIQSIAEVGESALPEVLKYAKNPVPEIRETCAKAFGKIGPASIPILDEMLNDSNIQVRSATADALAQVDNSSILSLLNDSRISKYEFIESIGNLGMPALSILTKLADSNPDEHTLVSIIIGLGKIGQEAIPTLNRFFEQSPYADVKKTATYWLEQLDDQKNSRETIDPEQFIYGSIMIDQPALINPAAKDLIAIEPDGNLYKLIDITARFTQKYPQLAGISVIGSTAKGYWRKGSDTDYCVIYNTTENAKLTAMERKEIETEIRNTLEQEGLKPCPGIPKSYNPTETKAKYEFANCLFQGIFIGNRQQLFDCKKQLLNRISADDWKQIQQRWIDHETGSHYKRKYQFGLSESEAELITKLRCYIWSLPDLDTMKQGSTII